MRRESGTWGGACRRAREAAAARSPQVAPARPPRRPRLRAPCFTTLAPLKDTRIPRADPTTSRSRAARPGFNPAAPGKAGDRRSERACGFFPREPGLRAGGARAPARAAVTPSSPRAPALTPTHHSPSMSPRVSSSPSSVSVSMVSRTPSSPLSSIARLGAEASLPSRSGRRGGGAAATTHDTRQPPPGTASPAGATLRHVCNAREGRDGIPPPQPAPSAAPPPGCAHPCLLSMGPGSSWPIGARSGAWGDGASSISSSDLHSEVPPLGVS